MSETERRVREEVCRVVANAANWPTRVGAQMLGRDLAEPIDKIVEALMPIIREVKADAWDECDDAWEFAHRMSHREPWEHLKDNPYKDQQ